MASVNFYNFAKRRNSTKTPSGSGTAYTVTLKEDTSLYEPVFILADDFPAYTYANFQNKYYYINDIVSIGNGLCEIHCELDPMGTAATAIGNTTAFVNRSASNYDIWLPDNELSSKANIVSHGHAVTALTGIFDTTGCYIMRVIGKSGIDTFILSAADLHDVLDFMFDDGNFTDVLGDAVVKAVFNPFQYIVSLQYTPFSFTWAGAGATQSHLNFGWWQINLDTYAKSATTGFHVLGQTLTMPGAYFNDFRDYDPRFTKCNMILPGGQTVTMPSSWLSLSGMKLEIVFDMLTGQGQFIITDSGSNILATFSTQLAFDVQIGQQAVNAGGLIQGAIGAAVAMESGTALGVVGSLAGAVQAVTQPNPSIIGSQQTAQFFQSQNKVEIEYSRFGSGSYAASTIGRILNQQVQLSTLSGYVKCSNASVSTNLPARYKDEINNYLNTGFFME